VDNRPKEKKELVGADVFVDWTGGTANDLGAIAEKTSGDLKLIMIDTRGTKAYPNGMPDMVTGDTWRLRFMSQTDGGIVTHEQIISLLGRVKNAGLDFTKFESLCNFDGKAGYSLSQGQ
jgi:isocitrate dehydrogenase